MHGRDTLEIKRTIKESTKIVGVVINKTYIENIIKNITSDFTLQNTIVLGTTNHTSHFNKENSSKSEVLLVFTR